MSYDFGVKMDAGNKYLYHGDLNYTYNVCEMFTKALGLKSSMTELNGKLMSEVGPIMDHGIQQITDNYGEYQAMNPKNGWGDVDGAIRVLRTLAEWSREYPNAMLDIT